MKQRNDMPMIAHQQAQKKNARPLPAGLALPLRSFNAFTSTPLAWREEGREQTQNLSG
jgi:hypothetical protein